MDAILPVLLTFGFAAFGAVLAAIAADIAVGGRDGA